MRQCECGDSGCTVGHGSACTGRKYVTLYRIDMWDPKGTYFCKECAEDAHDSGLFTRLFEFHRER